METVEVPYGKSPKETAILLLAAAERIGGDVKTTSRGVFVVPVEVAQEAGFAKKPAKKAPAKKVAAETKEEE